MSVLYQVKQKLKRIPYIGVYLRIILSFVRDLKYKRIPIISDVLEWIWSIVLLPIGVRHIAQAESIKLKYKPVMAINAIYDLLKKVELYQPLYNFPKSPADKPQRICFDRADTVLEYLKTMGIGGRILDVGCSLGYFSYYFAERGYWVDGIDMGPDNIAICRMLGYLNAKSVNFNVDEFSLEFAERIKPNQYDIAFIFSVLHHITYFKGIDYVQGLMAEITAKISILFIELAVHNEQTSAAWVNSLPKDDLVIFAKCKDITIEKLGDFPNHLSDIRRPLYVIKRKNIVLNNVSYPVHQYKFTSFDGSNYFNRSYYDCGDKFIKRYLVNRKIDSKANIIANIANKEIANNNKLSPNNEYFPKLLAYNQSKDSIELVFSKLPGENLHDKLVRGETVNALQIFKEIMSALDFLYQQGFYHNDVRLWNIMLDGEKVYLFDLGFASDEEIESTNLTLLWVIYQLHDFCFVDFVHPIKKAPKLQIETLAPAFQSIAKMLQENQSFPKFLEWYKAQKF